MSIKLLESSNELNPTLQNVDDGALINFQAACKADGVLFGCDLSNTTDSIKIATGTMMVRGYRLKFTQTETVYSLSNAAYPATATTYYLYLRLTRYDTDCEYEFYISNEATSSNKSPIEQVIGVFDYKVASFTLGASGIVGNVKSLMANIPTPGSGGSGGGNVYGSSGTLGLSSIQLYKPILELVQIPKYTLTASNIICGKANSLLCLKNKQAYSVLNTNGNVVKFSLYRYINKGRYRNKRNGAKLYIEKTGYVKPVKSLGYRGLSSDIQLTKSYSSLESQVVTSSGQYQYRRTDVLCSLKQLIDNMFYEIVDSVKTPITATTSLANIKCSRSTNAGQHYGRKGLYVKIAYKAELWNGGKKLAESDLSTPLIISINYNKKPASVRWGDWFRISLDEK